MRNLHRDLLMLMPENLYSKATIECEAGFLEKALNEIDTIDNAVKAVEYVNLHRGGITQNKLRIETALRRPVLDSFQFIIHKN